MQVDVARRVAEGEDAAGRIDRQPVDALGIVGELAFETDGAPRVPERNGAVPARRRQQISVRAPGDLPDLVVVKLVVTADHCRVFRLARAPHDDAVILPTRCKLPAVRAESQSENAALVVAEGLRKYRSPGPRAPSLHRSVLAGRAEHAPILAEGQPENGAAVRLARPRERLAGWNAPAPDHAVETARGER